MSDIKSFKILNTGETYHIGDVVYGTCKRVLPFRTELLVPFKAIVKDVKETDFNKYEYDDTRIDVILQIESIGENGLRYQTECDFWPAYYVSRYSGTLEKECIKANLVNDIYEISLEPSATFYHSIEYLMSILRDNYRKAKEDFDYYKREINELEKVLGERRKQLVDNTITLYKDFNK